MGFLFCRGLKFRPRVQVFREALNHERLSRTATHTLSARVAHTIAVEPAVCVAPVGSIREASAQHRSPIFFFPCGLDHHAVIRPSATELSLGLCLHVAPAFVK
jgi:hypothetical protein